jgi:tellurite methyltransferase
MNERIARWEERYARGEGLHEYRASPPLPLALDLAPPGLALDLAAGAGRHAVVLAEAGWRVVAVEGTRTGVDLMRREALRRGVSDRIDARVADLEGSPRGFEIAPDAYDLVCDFYFLDRSLFDEIRRGVRPGGLFVAAIHVEDPAVVDARSPSFLLAPGELAALVASWGWEILHAREGGSRDAGHHRATAEIVARRPAGL